MQKTNNFELATKILDTDDLGTSWAIHHFAIGRMVSTEIWKNDRSTSGIKTTELLQTKLKSTGNLISLAVDDIDPKEAKVWALFPKLTPHLLYNQMRVKIFYMDEGQGTHTPGTLSLSIAGHSTGNDYRPGLGNILVGTMNFFHVRVLQSTVLKVPDGDVFHVVSRSTFRSVVCKVELARMNRPGAQ